MSQSVTQTVDYPLDPLSSEEFTRVAAILSREHEVGDGWRIASIEMIEPGKASSRRSTTAGRCRLAAPR